MARGKPVLLSNGREWSTRQKAEDYFRELRDRYPLDTRIDDPQDHDDLCSLLERYDAAISGGPSKIGCGIKYFVSRENQTNGGKTIGFWVIRTDDTETDFSFITAVSGRPKKSDAEFLDACRESVYEAVKAATKAHFAAHADGAGRVVCEVTNEPVSSFGARIDYAPADFRDIVWAFRAAEGWGFEIPPGIISRAADGQLSTNFVDIDAMARFRMFHAANSQMRIVSKAAKRSDVLATRSQPIRNPVRL